MVNLVSQLDGNQEGRTALDTGITVARDSLWLDYNLEAYQAG